MNVKVLYRGFLLYMLFEVFKENDEHLIECYVKITLHIDYLYSKPLAHLFKQGNSYEQ